MPEGVPDAEIRADLWLAVGGPAASRGMSNGAACIGCSRGAPRCRECLMRGTIPPGVVVPLYSHVDSETFLQVSGEVEALVEAEDGFDWVWVRAGDVFTLRVGPSTRSAT